MSGPVTIRSEETKRGITFRVPVTIGGEMIDVALTVSATSQAIESEEHVLAAFDFARRLVQRSLEQRDGELIAERT